jgi:hypothetical protein
MSISHRFPAAATCLDHGIGVAEIDMLKHARNLRCVLDNGSQRGARGPNEERARRHREHLCGGVEH